jgi:hypothetical protein
MDQNVLVVLRARIDQHLKFFDTLERIRWQFTTTFGAGASVAVFLAVDDKSSVKRMGIALLLVFGFSAAGLVAQLRIFALISVLWKRMLMLQSKEFEVLREGIVGDASDLQKALSFPRLGVLNSRIFRILNVGMASCFLFSLFIGIAAGLAAAAVCHSTIMSMVSGLTITLVFAIISLVGAKRYALAVESSDEWEMHD